MRTRDGGFSLTEVLLAMALLAMVGVGAVSLLAGLTEHSTTLRDRTVCQALVVERLERSLVGGYDGLTVGSTTEDPIAGFDRFVAVTTVSNATARLRRVRIVVRSTTASDSLETYLCQR